VSADPVPQADSRRLLVGLTPPSAGRATSQLWKASTDMSWARHMVASSQSSTLVSPVQAHNQERPRRRRSEVERLLGRTILEPTHPELGTCWRFTGTTTPYGRIAMAQDSYTHRLGWKLLRGPIPEDKELHHRCGVHACWNPDHLQMVAHAENLAYRRKAHCKRGHLLSGANLRIDPRTGARSCRQCSAEHQRAFRERQAPSEQDDDCGASPIMIVMLTGRMGHASPAPSLL